MKWIKKVAATPLESVARVIDSLTSENERTNAPSIRAVKEAVDDGWLKIYPIGSIYMNVTNVDPATLFGGTWVQIEDTFLLACGDTYDNGATGGSATHTPSGAVGNHTLTAAEIPSHTHTYDKATQAASHALTVAEIPSHTHGVPWAAHVNSGYVKDAAASGYTRLADILDGQTDATSNATGGGSGHTHSITSASNNTGNGTGGNGAHNHSFTGTNQDTMPPYLAVYVWKRTA